MHFLLTTVGTDGDVLPSLRLGRELRARGHELRLVAAEPYERLAREAGLEFSALVSAGENEELFGHPDFWNPWKTAPLAARWGLRFLRRQYDLLAGLVREDTVLISSPGIFPTLCLHEKEGLPLISLLLQPGIIPSSLAPPVLPGLAFFRRAPAPVWDVIWRVFDFGGDCLLRRGLDGFRKELGLKPMRRILRNWLSRQLVIGMFPEWYAPPAADWPLSLRLTDFPLPGPEEGTEILEGPLRDFLNAGAPPVAFTFGTGLARPGKWFATALDACRIAEVRGIFLTRHLDQLPSPLPDSIFPCARVPFGLLFPRCAAVVHHGGIGTAAAALAAGLPQVICPICFDQADNAERLKLLGAGEGLPSGQPRADLVAEALGRQLSPDAGARCGIFRERLRKAEGVARAADAVEEFAARHFQSITC